jgi:hypothetical protein
MDMLILSALISVAVFLILSKRAKETAHGMGHE